MNINSGVVDLYTGNITKRQNGLHHDVLSILAVICHRFRDMQISCLEEQ